MAKVTSIEAVFLKIQLRWAGHVSRMEDHCLPKVILYGVLSTGHRDKLAPRKKVQRHNEKVPRHMQHRTPPVDNTISQSNELETHSLPDQTTTSFEVPTKGQHGKQKERRKTRDPSEINTGQIVTCSRCGKCCLS